MACPWPDVDQAINLLAADLRLPRSEVLLTIVRHLPNSGGWLRVGTVDEESGTDSTA
jgi:hypothetical protein